MKGPLTERKEEIYTLSHKTNPDFWVLLLGLLVWTGFLVWSVPGFGAEEGQEFTVMHTNDVHTHLLGFGPNSEYTPISPGDDNTQGGVSRLAAKVNEIRTLRNNPTVLADAGDFMMGTAFMLLRGKAQIGIMEALNYDATTLGNHEFDWRPSGTAEILSYISSPESLPIVASNIIFSDCNSQDPPPDCGLDDELEALYGPGNLIRPYFVKEIDGLRVGFFGLLGNRAAGVAPLAAPVTFSDPIGTAVDTVQALQSAGVDLIVCLSHSGIQEDSSLAGSVNGIDVILSGHTHEETTSPVIVGNTVIVQAGSYTEYLGVLDLVFSSGGWSVKNYQLVSIDDSIEGEGSIQTMVEDYIEEINTSVLNPMNYAFEQVVAQTDFDLTVISGEESTLGNLVTDSMRWMVDQYEAGPPFLSPNVDFALESTGIMRDDILRGESGSIAFSDAFRVLPLGIGLTGDVGYPIVTIYLTAREVKKALELILLAYPLAGGDYWLNVSGFRFEYNPSGLPLFRVLRIFVGNDVDGYSSTPLNTNPDNTTLYKVAVNYFLAQFFASIPELVEGWLPIPGIGDLMKIDPKDESGNSYLEEEFHPDGIDEARVDIDGNPENGIQELQQWRGFLDYIAAFEDSDGDDIPDIPDLYSAPTGRITETSCLVATAAYGSSVEPRINILRSFRDKVLTKGKLGRSLVEAYYKHSPPAARYIAERAWLKALVRTMLLPLIGFVSLFV